MTPVDLHHGAATDVGPGPRGQRGLLPRRRRRSSSSPTAWAATPAATSPAAIVVEEFARLADDGYDPHARRRGRRRRPWRAQPAPDRGVRRRPTWQRGRPAGTPAPPPWSPLLVEDDGEPEVAAGQPRRLAHLPLRRRRASTRSASTTRSSRSCSTPARSPSDEAAGPPGAARDHPRPGRPGALDPDFFLLPLAAARALLLCTDGVSGMIDDAEIERSSHRRRPARRRRRAGRGRRCDAGGQRQRHRGRGRCGGIGADTTYDSERQRESLESKLGGRQ